MNKAALKSFLALPIHPDETFQGGFVRLPDLLGVPGNVSGNRVQAKLSLALWCSKSSELVHAVPLSAEQQDDCDAFLGVMLELCANYEVPFRPVDIECNDQSMAEELSERLSDSGTEVSFVETMPEWNRILTGLKQHMEELTPIAPSIADTGCSEQQIREFAAAAAAFYHTKLWDLLDDHDLIKIETPKPLHCLKFMTVLGAGAQTYGLGFYDNEEDHYALMSQQGDVRDMNLCSLTFDNPASTAQEDVALWQELDLPLETGDAFPFAVFMEEDEPRCLTPKEFDFVTIVLKALAETSEDELDSGRWTKWVEHMGKRKKCVLSIPNLLDPPDHQEWIRRGKTPEMRGHEHLFTQMQEFIESQDAALSIDELNEVLNDKFSGPMDQFTTATNTPQERAEALCQEAIQTFGRRRIQLAKQALTEEPNHVEANILLAESTRNEEQAVGLFQQAKQSGKMQLGSEFEEYLGNFWSYHETRPFMRACHGLANALRAAGQTSDAIVEYQEMLRLNPNDNQGVRYELIPLLITHNRETDAIRILDAYREETAFCTYMRSLVEYRRSGNSLSAKKLIKSAFLANPYVVAVLQFEDPPQYPDSYSLGSPEEAMTCIKELSDAWEESEGYVDWMFGEYFAWEKDREKKLREKKRKQLKKTSGRKKRRK